MRCQQKTILFILSIGNYVIQQIINNLSLSLLLLPDLIVGVVIVKYIKSLLPLYSSHT